jgi:glucose-6-phosphate isomerase
MKKCAKRIQENSDILVVVGIGGSYLGARAVIEALNHSFYNDLSDEKRKFPKVMFLGNNISPVYLTHFMDIIEGKDISVNVISKSGTTTEPALAFRIMRKYMEDKYGKEGAKDRIIATTDYNRGALRELANQEGYETFGIKDDMVGRFSVLSSVGLLPIAVAGIDVDALMAGAAAGYDEYMATSLEENECYKYAALRNFQLNNGKDIELFVDYEPQLHFTAEWWKQLMGESEGKDGKGLFPAAVDYSTDLHSMGQYVQDGQRILFETILNVENVACDIAIEEDEQNLDNLNYLVGETMDFVNKNACKGTVLAHVDGGVPNVIINIDSLTPFNYGKLLYFFMKSCAMSCYMIDVNPFNQPGVEDYKKNMFALLGKPGFEALREELLKK